MIGDGWFSEIILCGSREKGKMPDTNPLATSNPGEKKNSETLVAEDVFSISNCRFWWRLQTIYTSCNCTKLEKKRKRKGTLPTAMMEKK